MELPDISFGDLLRFEHITSLFSCLYMSMLTSNSSGKKQKHGYLGCFHAASTRENISGVCVIHAHSWGKNQHWSRKEFGTQQLPRHYGRETHICVSKLGAIDSDNGLSPVRCQVIIWKNSGFILTGPLVSYLSEIVTKAILYSEKALEMSSPKQRPFHPGLNVLIIIM